ncbi:MAG TPA: polyprenyl diphosphate synthase [Candidatus Saccharimonadales bacterium]|nr:polyprenyl diphosphate synthase [Candidatus Saccharimonadales bacterium]
MSSPGKVASDVPNHIGFIVDGNRRWAKSHGLPSYEGHLAGYEALKDVVLAAADAGVKYISLYTFSTENWSRAEEEVAGLMKLMMRLFKTDLHILTDNDLKLEVLGSRQGLPDKMNQAIDQAEATTASGQRSTVAVCFNYSGQNEITAAVQALMEQAIEPEAIDTEAIRANLYKPNVPDCDLIVRTSGEQRLSNFMMWRSAYSELIFLDKFWPDMRPKDVADIIDEYKRRQRRYGK